MATSGTYAWAPDNTDIIETAYSLAGWDMRTGYDARAARFSLNLILTEWATRGVNLWTIEQATTDCVDGTASYALDAKTIDVLDAVIRISDVDTPLERITMEQYLQLPDKTTEGVPSQYAVLRGTTQPTLYLYNVPDASTYDIVYWRIRYMQDIGHMAQSPDVPRRFLPALVWRLAYDLALQKPTNSLGEEAAKENQQKRVELKAKADELWTLAAEEDRDRASLYLRF